MEHEEPLVKISKHNRNNLSVSPKVNQKIFRDAFNALPLPKSVSKSACEQAGRILCKADGTLKEYQVAIDARTGEVLADNLDMPAQDKRTGFTTEQKNRIVSSPNGAIVIHNHPQSKPPSYCDVRTSAMEDSIKGTIVVCHNADVWYFAVNNPKIADELETLYNDNKDLYGEFAEIRAVNTLVNQKRIDWRWPQ